MPSLSMVPRFSVSDPDPGSAGSVIFSRIRIRLENNGSGSGSKSQICQKLFIFEQNFNKCKDENAKFLLNVQGFEYLRRFLIDKGNPQNFSFQKRLRNFETLNFCQDSARIRWFWVGSRSGSRSVKKDNGSETLVSR